MKALSRLSSIVYSDPVENLGAEDARIVLVVTADSTLSHRLTRALRSERDAIRRDPAPAFRVSVAAGIAQARSCIGRVAPDVILLDESIAAPNLYTHVLQDLAGIAPVVLLAAPENLARWCVHSESFELITQNRVECVARQGDFVPLAARLLERHANPRAGHSPRHVGSSLLGPAPGRVGVDLGDAPLDFGEVLRHEVNNPLTGILGNAELLLSRRDRLAADIVERLEIIADLAIRLRETVRRLSNALERRNGRPPAHSPDDLASSHRHRPPT